MTNSKLPFPFFSCTLMRAPGGRLLKDSIEILVAFVRDAEHEMLAVATSLQAQIDLIEKEQSESVDSAARFPALNRAVSRLVSDATILTSVSELTLLPRVKTRQNVETMMRDIATETRSKFANSEVYICCNIAPSIHVYGRTEAFKLMFKETVLALLLECEKLETIRISAKVVNKNVCLSFDTGTKDKLQKFEPWRLGKLRLHPINGEGISLAAIDAVARLNSGRLSVKSLPNRRHEYRLSFAA